MAVPARDRKRLERLCRYVARPPLATERLSQLPDGRVLYKLKNRWRDGTTHIVLEPLELLEKLAALIPPPRFNMVRYHGILAPAAKHRAAVVPKTSSTSPSTHPDCEPGSANASSPSSPSSTSAGSSATATNAEAPALDHRPRNYTWAELMRRVFEVDVLECPACGSRMRILATIHPPEATRKILECLDLPARATPVAPPYPALIAQLDSAY